MIRADGKEATEIRYVEFYAGIGGWRQALENIEEPLPPLRCVAALDHSDVCRTVYQYNWPKEDFEIQPIESVVTDSKWKEWNADIAVLSPPCQPHTRQHDNQDSDLNDPRSRSFLHICHLMKKQIHLPALLILENVVGFESSRSLQFWLEAIIPNYRVAHFHLDPTQVGTPNDRPRYYCIAVRNDRFSPERGCTGDSSLTNECDWIYKYFPSRKKGILAHGDGISLHRSISELGVVPRPVPEQLLPVISEILAELSSTELEALNLTKEQLQKQSSWCLDIVGKDSHRTSCFTSSYGKFFKGTGSVLAYKTENCPAIPFVLLPPEQRTFDPDWFKHLLDQGYTFRYFSGEELVRLFGFRRSFKFPPATTTKQKWKLIGNSLNVRVASKVVLLGLLASGLTKESPLSSKQQELCATWGDLRIEETQT